MALNLSDGIIKWTKYTENDILCRRFPVKNWNYIISDINSDVEWANLLKDSLLIRCYILKQCSTNEQIAFAYTKQEDLKGKIISLHGGGWGTNPSSKLMFYRGFILLIEYFLNKGIRVRTSCLESNITGYRFIKSVGFVNYKLSNNYFHFWINTKRLESNKIRKFLIQRN